MLVEGRMVVRICGAPHIDLGSEDFLAPDAVYVDEWLHAGFVQLSPWSVTFQRVVGVPDLQETVLNENRVYVKATG